MLLEISIGLAVLALAKANSNSPAVASVVATPPSGGTTYLPLQPMNASDTVGKSQLIRAGQFGSGSEGPANSYPPWGPPPSGSIVVINPPGRAITPKTDNGSGGGTPGGGAGSGTGGGGGGGGTTGGGGGFDPNSGSGPRGLK